VRFPAGWGAAFHPQAARRGGSSGLLFRPGYRGSGMQPVTATPVTAYTGKVSGVPLTGGQAIGTIPGYQAATGSLTSPLAGNVIVSVTVAPGTYTVPWTVALSGTPGGADTNNFQLYNGNSFVAESVNAGSAGSYPQTARTFTVTAAAPQVSIRVASNGTAGAVYTGTLPSPAGSGTLTLTVAPQGLGTVWYPAQATLSTTTGALDTSVALMYLGPAVTPSTLVGTVYSGNGTVALAIPDMSPGQTLSTQWTGGHPGDVAAVNVIGTMDALTTG